MALSQIQCLNEHHVNLRINQSKPGFLYSEEQRLALEKLLDEGPVCFQEFIKTNQIRPFLSDLELARLSASVEPYCPDLPEYSAGFDGDGDGDGTRRSLQYWPELSDDSLPQLELGWPQSASYRGVTRVAVHAQPPLHGDAHIKEVIRRAIAQAQKVIAVVMDLFTDVDIFKDLLHASFKRNVAVYIVLEITAVPHFLKMCESAAMHTGHLKNLRVRSIRGMGFFTHSSKKICGSQCQKFMFVDGDKAISGSYSFTWTASRLDRSIITVLTGQAVDLYDQLFQDLYMMSNAVNLNKINLEKEQKLEPICKAAPRLQLSTTTALKLINPKYALVSGNAAPNSSRVDSETCTAKGNGMKEIKQAPEGACIHPGLLHLKKANMIEYLPVWPEPDPSNDVIGFINIRDCNKPFQAHLTRSELFEVSQAIRFKDPIHMPQESLAEKVCPWPTFPAAPLTNEQIFMQPQTRPEDNNKHFNPPQQIPPPSSMGEQVVFLSLVPNPKTAHSSEEDVKESPVDQQTDVSSKQNDTENIIASTSAQPCKDSQLSENAQTLCSTVRTHTLVAQPEITSDKPSFENIAENVSNKDIRDDQWKTHEIIEPDTNATCPVDGPVQNGDSTNSESSLSSGEYFECYDNVIVDFQIGTVEDNTATETLSSIMSAFCEKASSNEVMKITKESKPQSASPDECHGQHSTGVTTRKSSDLEFTSLKEENVLSDSFSKANKQQIQDKDSTSQQGTQSKLLHQVMSDAPNTENSECQQECESSSVVNHMFGVQPVEENKSAKPHLLVNKSLMQDKVYVPYVPVWRPAEAQCIMFSEPVNNMALLRLNPEICSGFNNTSDLKSALGVNDNTHSVPLLKPAFLTNSFQKSPYTEIRRHKEAGKLIKPLIARETTLEQAIESNSELKERATAQTVDQAQQVKPKTVTGFKVEQPSVDIHPSKRKTLEDMFVQQNQSAVKIQVKKKCQEGKDSLLQLCI